MNHLNTYVQIINNAKLKNRKRYKKTDKRYVYYEKHHILPNCLGGSNDKENLILLTAKEHFICHKLLVHIYTKNRKLVCALNRMTYSKRYDKNLSSRDYALVKELMNLTPMSKETRKKMSDAKKGNLNPNKNGLSEEHKRKIRNQRWKHSKETIEKLKKVHKGPRPNRIKKYKLISPDKIEYVISTRRELYRFIAEKKLSQRKIIANINNGIISEKDFNFLKKTSIKTIGWEIKIL